MRSTTLLILAFAWQGRSALADPPSADTHAHGAHHLSISVDLDAALAARAAESPDLPRAPGGRSAALVNWESPHVHPLDSTPDGLRLIAVNTPDSRIEVFDLSGPAPVHIGSYPVGLDPVSVRARSNAEVWVINHVSDSVSVVDLTSGNVVATLAPGDEPTDVVFAGTPQRAFVCVSQLNQVKVYDPANLAAPPIVIQIAGEDPRALATDGVRVYAAIFESGNRTTILGQPVVSSSINPYPGDANPPPNSGSSFSPPRATGQATPPPAGMIVRKNATGQWMDDNSGNWTAAVTWDLHDHDVAILDANSLGLSYVTGLMNLNMAIGLRGGEVTVVGTEALNQVRFEPNIRGRFLRVLMARFNGAAPGAPLISDLNPHLTYASSTVPPATRALSIGDPRAVVWNAGGSRGFVAGMGSNNVVVLDAAAAVLARFAVPPGPTGLVLDEPRGRLYVLSKFAATLTTVDASSFTTIAQHALFDPTPPPIRAGRPHLYDTHATSGLGHVSCGSCHVDGRMDQLAWDLGDPSQLSVPFEGVCNFGGGGCENPHPMKGAMVTQTLVGIIDTEPLHWRGDRTALSAFNPAFVNLLGADAPLTATQMTQLTDFVATLRFPPNPNRNFDDSLPSSASNGGNPANGLQLYTTLPLDGGAATCVSCHALPTGKINVVISGGVLQEPQSMVVPQLRNLHEKTGFSQASSQNNRGFGFTHDGAVATLFQFLQLPVFRFAPGATGDAQRRDIEAFLFAFSTDTHAAVGVQTTVTSGAAPPPAQAALIDGMRALADANSVGLIVKGRVGGILRGYAYQGNSQFQSDRQAETIGAAALLAQAASAQELTYTVVPAGRQTIAGIDRDGDGAFDRDELDACSDPADPDVVPGGPGSGQPGDANGDHQVDQDDLDLVLFYFGTAVPPGTNGDVDRTGFVDQEDLDLVLFYFGQACEQT